MSALSRRHLLGSSLAVAAVTVGASACSDSGSGSDAAASNSDPVQGGSFTWGVQTEPVSFDPHNSSQQNAFFVIRNYVDSLIGKQSDGSFAPWLATEWTISPDGLRYDFTLRDDVTFHDGEKFTAAVAKANLDRVKDPANALSAATLLQNYASAEATDDTHLAVLLTAPDSGILESLSSVKLGFVSTATLALGDQIGAGGSGVAGTGPFTFTSYTRGQSAVFTKNADYQWGPGYAQHTGPAYLDEVTYRFLPEAATRTGALSSGQVQAIDGVQATDEAQFDGVTGYQFLRGPSTNTSFTLNVNYTHAPADDLAVRQALRDGFDADAVVQSVYRGTVDRAWSNVGPDNVDYDATLENSWGNDVDGANDALDAAGWTERDGDGYRTKDGQRLTIEVGYPQPYVRDQRDLLIQAVQAELKQNIGLDLALNIYSAGEFTAETNDGTWSIYPNTMNPLDVALNLRQLHGRGAFLYQNTPTIDEEIDSLTAQAIATPDLDTRRPVLAQVQQRAVDQAFIVPLFAPRATIAAADTVGGLGFEAQLDLPANSYDVWAQA